MIIAIPVAQGRLCPHFGHPEHFALLHVDEQGETVFRTETVTPPPHAPGVLPEWLADLGVNVVLVGGIGSRAKSLFVQKGITVITGVPAEDPGIVVQAYLAGTLVTGDNACDH